jgi:hypothetical protein
MVLMASTLPEIPEDGGFLEAIQQIVKEFPKVKLLLVGRSGQMEESVVRPMKRLGIEPATDAVFAPVLKKSLRPDIEVAELPMELNSAEFAEALAAALDKMIKDSLGA